MLRMQRASAHAPPAVWCAAPVTPVGDARRARHCARRGYLVALAALCDVRLCRPARRSTLVVHQHGQGAHRSRCRVSATRSTANASDDWERIISGPRMEAGLDVHRRVHALAGKHAAYMFQWRAFCERQQRSWQAARTVEDEGIIAGAARCVLGSTRA